MARRLALLASCLLVLRGAMALAVLSDTVNRIPQPGASFTAQNQEFDRDEDSDRFHENACRQETFVSSGCIGTTAASLTHTPSSCIAYARGYRLTETGSVSYSDVSTCWLIYDRNVTGDLTTNITFTRVPSTHYLRFCGDGLTTPTLPTGTGFLMRVTTASGAITAVVDLRDFGACSGAGGGLTCDDLGTNCDFCALVASCNPCHALGMACTSSRDCCEGFCFAGLCTVTAGATTTTTTLPTEGCTTVPTTDATFCTANRAPDWSVDARFKGIWNFEEADQEAVVCGVLDASPTGTNLSYAAGNETGGSTTFVRQGCRALHTLSSVDGGASCATCPACAALAPNPMWFPASFTVGCWERVLAATTNAWSIATDATNGDIGTGYQLGTSFDGTALHHQFAVDGPLGQIWLTSATTTGFGAWHHHVARATAGVTTLGMAQVIDGVPDVSTATASIPLAWDTLAIGIGAFHRVLEGDIDECFGFTGVMSDVDVCRIAVCGIDGCGCECSGSTYTARPKHSSAGGPIACTMPAACNKAAPD